MAVDFGRGMGVRRSMMVVVKSGGTLRQQLALVASGKPMSAFRPYPTLERAVLYFSNVSDC
ncbi:hypothetical protein BN2476_110110 [Paraburkholderia piptadeniae]|uniref:Uncharacterized protein n=1 Tax=Paraburkholderia piptadeniae TaxID=1701573 RepID=A0A1N7RPT3_9BURK|nr:hypothetical protein BN2476_110110 [Paraburkholderia piptadeniae]